MKCIGLVSESGKPEPLFMNNLADELRHRSHKFAWIEQVTDLMDCPDKTPEPANLCLPTVVRCFPSQTRFSFERSMSLDDVLALVDADLVLLSGFEDDRSYPRMVIMEEGNFEQDFLNGLEIAGYGTAHSPSFPVTPTIKELVDIIEEKAFKLPNLNCEACGLDSCYAFAKEVVKGSRPLKDCVSLNPEVTIEIDGVPLPMNPFISGIVEKTVRALVSSFKGYKKGSIHVTIG